MDKFEELKIVSVFSYFHTVGDIPANLFFFSVILFGGLLMFATSAWLILAVMIVVWFAGLSVAFKNDPQAMTIIQKTITQKPAVLVNPDVPYKRFVIV